MGSLTFDSTTKLNDPLVLKTEQAGWHIAFVTVSEREAKGTPFKVWLEPEIGVWDESSWDNARWADDQSSYRLEQILTIISNGSFPRNRDRLQRGQRHQLRDAMILEAHAAAGRDVFVTADAKAFIKNGRRAQLQALLQTRILTPTELRAELGCST